MGDYRHNRIITPQSVCHRCGLSQLSVAVSLTTGITLSAFMSDCIDLFGLILVAINVSLNVDCDEQLMHVRFQLRAIDCVKITDAPYFNMF